MKANPVENKEARDKFCTKNAYLVCKHLLPQGNMDHMLTVKSLTLLSDPRG